VVGNLISNSIRYSSPDRESFVRIHLGRAKRAGRSFISIEVSDNGIGIPKSEKKRIFEKFFRASNTAKVGQGGTGLGLYLIKKVADEVGGIVSFESEENQGAVFTFLIPEKGMRPKKGEVSLLSSSS
jgi:two-component system, OmpR family, sensor histidine kinase SenX3